MTAKFGRIPQDRSHLVSAVSLTRVEKPRVANLRQDEQFLVPTASMKRCRDGVESARFADHEIFKGLLIGRPELAEGSSRSQVPQLPPS